MTIRLVDKGWDNEFYVALSADSSELRIICPFIKTDSVERLLSWKPGNVQVITRFNLADFSEGVSDITALRKLLDANASVRGVRNLHAKLYLFGTSRAIITSANLTEAALTRNHELGLVTEDATTIAKCRAYFSSLWKRAGKDLIHDQVNAWNKTVTNHRVEGGRPNQTNGLGDFGVDVGVTDPIPAQIPTVVAHASQAFVKLLGKADNRVTLSYSTIDEIKGSDCHSVACYPTAKRPRGVRDTAIIFMGRLTKNQNDIRIFGRAIGMKYEPGRDDATETDIARRSWKKDWSRYIRVHHPEFVAGTMENGISLNEMMNTLSVDSFASTQRNAASGKGNTNPRRAYSQQAHVELSTDGLLWLSKQLQAAFETYGKVPQDTLDTLVWPNPSTIA